MTIPDDERREVAAKMREGVNEGRPFCGFAISGMLGVSYFEEVKCWNRLIDLIEPAPTSSDRGLTCDRDALLELARRVELLHGDPTRRGCEACGYFGVEGSDDIDCEDCEAYEREEMCLDVAVSDIARRIRETVSAFERDSDAPLAGDTEQIATDVHEDDNGAADGGWTDLGSLMGTGTLYACSEQMHDAAVWVEEHGGLDAVKAKWESHVPLAHLKRSNLKHKERIVSIQRHVEYVQAKCSDRKREIERLKSELDAMRPRLMPPGMEWPRYEDGEPVRIGDELEHKEQGHRFTVDVIEFMGDGWRACYEENAVRDVYRPGERVKRPAPRVLDADGVEIRVGDTLYYVDGREQRVNTAARLTDSGLVQFGTINEAGHVTYCEAACIPPDHLTHRAPVLAADGKPLRKGDTVYVVETGCETVIDVFLSDSFVACLEPGTDDRYGTFEPRELTHERPDTRARIIDGMDKETVKRIDRLVRDGRWLDD